MFLTKSWGTESASEEDTHFAATALNVQLAFGGYILLDDQQ